MTCWKNTKYLNLSLLLAENNDKNHIQNINMYILTIIGGYNKLGNITFMQQLSRQLIHSIYNLDERDIVDQSK